VKEDISYEDLKDFSEQNLPRDVKTYNEFHALLVRLGKEHCRKSRPICTSCPLGGRCPKKGVTGGKPVKRAAGGRKTGQI